MSISGGVQTDDDDGSDLPVFVSAIKPGSSADLCGKIQVCGTIAMHTVRAFDWLSCCQHFKIAFYYFLNGLATHCVCLWIHVNRHD